MSESTQQEEKRIEEEAQEQTPEPPHEEHVAPGSPGTVDETEEKD